MRVAVVGATGNAGSAVLAALAQTPQVTSILGIARRMPDRTESPYAGCDWAQIDVAAASAKDTAVAQLAQAFEGADAVIHLAWLVQPNSRRDLLRRVNVGGTERVAEAVARAGVPHLVVASSVGAYSPDTATERRDESWPTDGINTSHYSVDKAAQERVLDQFSAQHPDIAVTRLRPALIFGASAGSEIQRYFLGSWIPLQLLRTGRLPLLPVPRALRGVQSVHRDDVARAYVAAVVTREPGAFNICADDVLGPQELADIVDHGKFVRLPSRLMRAALSVGHSMKLVAADQGWLDMALAVPLMDNSKAKDQLGWRPEHSAAVALHRLLDGMAEGDGLGSVPMRPRAHGATWPSIQWADPASSSDPREPSPGAAQSMDLKLLNLYLNDHLVGATAGSERIKRMAADFSDTPVFATLSEVADQIQSERTFLNQLIAELGFQRRRGLQATAWVGERVGRLKMNGTVIARSPLTMVLEAELLRSAVQGKTALWQTLEDNAAPLGLDPAQFRMFGDMSRDQQKRLEAVHEYARTRAFQEGTEVFDHESTQSPVGSSSSVQKAPGETV